MKRIGPMILQRTIDFRTEIGTRSQWTETSNCPSRILGINLTYKSGNVAQIESNKISLRTIRPEKSLVALDVPGCLISG